jgi:hypothetical protein
VNRAAIGLAPHSGWAALVAVACPKEGLRVVDRRRVALAGADLPRQPYHAAEDLPLEVAEELLGRCARDSENLAKRALADVIGDLSREGYEAVGCGLLLASGRKLPKLADVLASHALIHTADGEHYREALTRAATSRELPVSGIREKELWDRAAAALRLSENDVRKRIDAAGKPLGPPWTADQKHAAALAWVALRTAPKGRSDARGEKRHSSSESSLKTRKP